MTGVQTCALPISLERGRGTRQARNGPGPIGPIESILEGGVPVIQRNFGLVRKTTGPTANLQTLSNYYLNSDGSVYQTFGPYSIASGRTSSEIVYTTKPKGLRSQSNLCMHTQYTFTNPSSTFSAGIVSLPGKTVKFDALSGGVDTSRGAALAAFESQIGVTRFGVLGANAQGYINDAFAKLRPDLTSVSIPNFLLELDDIPRLWQQFKYKLSLAKRAAGLKLSWDFGLRPLIGDLQNIKDAISTSLERVKEWNKTAGTIYQKSATLSNLNNSSSGTETLSLAPHVVNWRGSRSGTVSAFLTFKTLAIPALTEAETMLRTYLDALGFELNPRIVWDAIPFSFVLDWFFDVGGWLQRFKIDTLELPIVLADSCLQYKEDLKVEHYWKYTPDGLYTSYPTSPSGSQSYKTFHRMPMYPDQSGTTAQGWSMLNSNQAINLLALGTALLKLR